MKLGIFLLVAFVVIIPYASASEATIKHHTFACRDVSDEQELVDMHNSSFFRLTLDAFN